MTMSSGPAAALPVTQRREFWVLMGYAVVLGVFGAIVGLVFIGVITFGGKWYAVDGNGQRVEPSGSGSEMGGSGGYGY